MSKVSLCVSFTGFSGKELKSLESMVKQLGGEVTSCLTKATSVLVVQKVGSSKHHAALQHSIAVVGRQWLLDSVERGSFVDYRSASYHLSIFTGLNVCFTGFVPTTRAELANTVQNNGGNVSASMTKEFCSHLIVETCDSGNGNNKRFGDKYWAALSWGTVKIVSRDWLDTCMQQGHHVSEESFFVRAEESHAEAHPSDTTAATNNVDNNSTTGIDTSMLPANQANQATQAVAGIDVIKATDSVSGSIDSNTSAAGKTAISQLNKKSGLDIPSEVQKLLAKMDSTHSSRFRKILQSELCFLAGFSREDSNCLLKLIMCGGGIVSPFLDADVSLVLFGDFCPLRLQYELSKQEIGCPVVSGNYIIDLFAKELAKAPSSAPTSTSVPSVALGDLQSIANQSDQGNNTTIAADEALASRPMPHSSLMGRLKRKFGGGGSILDRERDSYSVSESKMWTKPSFPSLKLRSSRRSLQDTESQIVVFD